MSKRVENIIIVCIALAIGFVVIEDVHRSVTQSGIGLGSTIAVVLSWHRNKSILLAILHGVLSWIYVIYFALTRSDE